MLNQLHSYFKQEKELYDSVSIEISAENFIFPESKAVQQVSEVIHEKKIEPIKPIVANTTLSANLVDLKQSILNCQNCSLCEHRTQVVFGSGNSNADLMIIGESPGFEEDTQGLPFVGKGGQLLTKMLTSINIPRENVYVANIVNCRPENNRDPKVNEISACLPYLKQQIEFVKPKLILSLGRIAGQALTESKSTLGEMRGKFHSYLGTALFVTYHPAALLRNPSWKKPTWDDLKQVKSKLLQLENN